VAKRCSPVSLTASNSGVGRSYNHLPQVTSFRQGMNCRLDDAFLHPPIPQGQANCSRKVCFFQPLQQV
jgi:hypothetical protein